MTDTVMTCEACGDDIFKGNKYQPGYDGQSFCENCAYSYAEAAASWADHDLTDDDDRAQAEGARKALADHVAAGGAPSDIPLIVA
jgi:hypothetical protein